MSSQIASKKYFKILVLGNASAGKSAFLQAYIKQHMEHYFPALNTPQKQEDEFQFRMIFDNTTILFSEYDTSLDVDEKFYKEADAAIIIVQAEDNYAVENAAEWISSMVHKRGKMLPTIVVGNFYEVKNPVKVEDMLEHLYNLGNSCACFIPYVEVQSFDEDLQFIIDNLITIVECKKIENCAGLPAFLRGGCGIKQHYKLLKTK